jgi:hypothetical protein
MFSAMDVYIEQSTELAPLNRSILNIDCDTDAELLTIIDRKSLSVLINQELSTNSIVSILLPESYATGDKVMVIILDNDGEYNSAVLDGVSAELVNLR